MSTEVPNQNHSTSKDFQQGQQQSPLQPKSHNINTGPLISLLNFDPHSKSKNFINSPRSKEALKRLCIEDQELLVISKEEFKNHPIPPEFQDDKDYFCEVKAEHYEKRRKEKLKMALQERQDVIKQENYTGSSLVRENQTANGSDGKTDHQVSYYSTSYFDHQGKKKLQQMRNQQKKEIDMIFQTELKTQEMIKKNEEKLLRMQELEQRRSQEVEMKHKLAEEAQRRREMVKMEREREQEEINRIIAEKQRIEEMRRNEVQEKLEKERERIAIEKEKERREKNVQREKKIVELEQQKLIETEKRKEEREQRLARIQNEFEKAQKRKQIQSVQTRRQFDAKIETVRKKADDNLEEQRRKVLERQEITNHKKQKLEEDKRRQLEERRNRSEAKLQEIKKTLEEKFHEEQARKAAYLYKYQKAEENKKIWESELEQQRREKAQREYEKEQRLKQILAENEEKLFKKNTEFLQTLNQETHNAQERKEQNIRNLKKKYIMDILKMEDAYENNRRLEQVRENKKKQFLDKITETSQRLEQVQLEKERAFLERKKLQNQLEAEKAQTLKEFERKKKSLLAHKQQADNISFNPSPDSLGRNSASRNMYSAKSTPKLAPIGQPEAKSVKNGRETTGRRTTDKGHKNDYSFDKNIMVKKPATVVGTKNSQRLPATNQKGGQDQPQQQPKIEAEKSQRNNLNSFREDVVISDLQTKEYQHQSSSLRKEQLGELLKMVDEAVNDDKDQKKIESNTNNLIVASQKQDEHLNQLRSQNNYLLLA